MTDQGAPERPKELEAYRATQIIAAEARVASTRWEAQRAEKDLGWWQTAPLKDIFLQKKETDEAVAFYAEEDLKVKFRQEGQELAQKYDQTTRILCGVFIAAFVAYMVFRRS